MAVSLKKKETSKNIKGESATPKATAADGAQARAKTEALERRMLPVKMLEPSSYNPNEMSDRQFNLLHDNIRKVGITDPILVRPIGKDRYRIVGGAHRYKVAEMLGFKEVPCTILNGKDFSEDEEKFQMVRHNVIHGKMSPRKFVELYQSLSKKYTEEVAAESFGFATEEEFRRLVKTTAAGLPQGMQEQFKEAAKELKSIEQLAKLLNHLFSTYGDTLPYGYMIFDFGGKESVWLRMEAKTRGNFDRIAANCKTHGRALDHVMAGLMEFAVERKDVLESLTLKAKVVKIKPNAPLPTLDFLS